jgi:hypothetical protein
VRRNPIVLGLYRKHPNTQDTCLSQPLDIMYVDHATLIRVVGTRFAKDVLATRYPGMTPCLTDFELLSAARRFARIRVVFIVGVVACLTDPFGSGAG